MQALKRVLDLALNKGGLKRLGNLILSMTSEANRFTVVKVNLHSIRFRPFSSVFFTFLLLLEKVCAFSSAFL